MANDRILRAVLRLEPDKGSITQTVDDVERVEASVEELDQAVKELSLGQRIKGGVGRAVSGLQFGKLSDEAVEKLEYLGDGFEQLIDTMEELGVELDGTAQRALRAATSLNRIQTDPIGAVVQAVGQAVGAFQAFTGQIDKGSRQVGGAWDEVLGKEFESAAQVAEEYAAAQARVAEAHDKGGLIADLLVNKSEVLNASQEQLQKTLVDAASDYRTDYIPAVEALNDARQEGAEIIVPLTEAEYELMRARQTTLDLMGDAVTSVVGQVAAMAAAAAEAAETPARLHALADDFDQFQKALKQAETDFEAERERIGLEYQARLSQIEEQTGERRAQIMEQFVAQAEAAETAYYARRAEIVAQAGVEAARAEQDHQRRMQRMREDAALRERDLIGARDALGLKREREANERERRRADEDFDVQQARRSEDVARQLEQMRVAFEAQQAERQRQYEQQLRELDENAAKEQARLEAENDAKQAELETAYRAEQNMIRAAFDQRRQDLGVFLAGEREALRRHYEQTARALEAWIERSNRIINRAGGGMRRRQEGGYVGAGVYQVGERGREFVLSHATTRAAEARTGGALTQAAILGAMGGTNNVQFSPQITITDARDPVRTARLVQRELYLAMDRLLDEVS